MSWIQIILLLIGGLSLFLYGMKLMSEGLQKTAGNRLRRLLEKLTKNRVLAVIAGTVVTAVVQSSTATTVMVVGFVNAGLIKLAQAVGVIMGANIGSTFTGLLVTFKISVVAPLIAFVGIVLLMTAKNVKTKNIGQVIAGVGILFMGMNIMSDAVKPLSSDAGFMWLIEQAQIPFIGLVAGAVLTAILQSSAAMIGVLIALAAAGALSLHSGVFILFGSNIGTCVTAIIASLGGTKAAKRTAIVHLLFNVIGATVFTVIVTLPLGFVDMLERSVGGGVAMQLVILNVIFSVATTILLLPFVKQLIWLVSHIVKGEDKPREEARLIYIEPKAFTAAQVRQEVERMAQIAIKNYRLSIRAFFDKRTDIIGEVMVNEEVINFLDHEIARYLVKTSVRDIDDADREMISSLYQVVSLIERIGDNAENIAEFTETSIDKDRVFSEEAMAEIKAVAGDVEKALEQAIRVFVAGKYDGDTVESIQEMERNMYAEVVRFKGNHLERSKESVTERKVGLIFANMLEDLRQMVHYAGGIARSLEYQKEL